MQEQAPRLALVQRVNQDLGLHRVEIVGVVGSELEIPRQLTGRDPERHHAVGPEVVPGAGSPVVDRSGIPGPEIDQTQLRIVRSRQPRGTASRRQRLFLPRFAAGRARLGDSVVAPHPLPRLRVVRVDEAANPELTSRDPDQDQGADRQRRGGEGISAAVVRRADFPPHPPVPGSRERTAAHRAWPRTRCCRGSPRRD